MRSDTRRQQKLIPLTIKRALEGKEIPVYGDGQNVRDWLYVEDNCRGIDLVLHKGRIGEVYNIGGGNEWKNIELVNLICEILSEETGKDEKEYKKLKVQKRQKKKQVGNQRKNLKKP